MPLSLYSYNPQSEGARELADALGIRRLRHEGSTYVANPRKTIINWGSSTIPAQFRESRILNSPDIVKGMSNKKTFFEIMSDYDNINLPEHTTDANTALGWAHEGKVVCARTVLNGHSGNGLVMINSEVDFVRAPLYTMYVKKKAEYRVHFAMRTAIDVQRKIRRPGADVLNWQVRNHDNGFIFVRNDIVVPDGVGEQAWAVFEASGLDFGAVDMIWNESEGKAYALEINTAPGLSGQTIASYAEAFRPFV